MLIVTAASSQAGMQDMAAAANGSITYRKTAAESGNRTLLEYTWNHTTPVAMKVDRGLTYIQTAFEPARHVEQVKALEKLLGGEVLIPDLQIGLRAPGKCRSAAAECRPSCTGSRSKPGI